MATYEKTAEAVKGIRDRELDGTGLRIAICYTRWNEAVISAIVSGAQEELKKLNLKEKDILLYQCPGAYELPYTASRVIKKEKVDAVICVGCLIKGDTMHFEYISEGVTQGIMKLNLETGVPVLFGVLECLNEEQAKLRAGLLPGGHNHGPEWAQSAVEMATLRRQTKKSTLQKVPELLLSTALVFIAVTTITSHFYRLWDRS